jgi:hypothetical protein
LFSTSSHVFSAEVYSRPPCLQTCLTAGTLRSYSPCIASHAALVRSWNANKDVQNLSPRSDPERSICKDVTQPSARFRDASLTRGYDTLSVGYSSFKVQGAPISRTANDPMPSVLSVVLDTIHCPGIRIATYLGELHVGLYCLVPLATSEPRK